MMVRCCDICGATTNDPKGNFNKEVQIETKKCLVQIRAYSANGSDNLDLCRLCFEKALEEMVDTFILKCKKVMNT